MQITIECRPFIISTGALCEELRRDVLAALDAKLQRVAALRPRQVITQRVKVLVRILRRVRIWPYV